MYFIIVGAGEIGRSLIDITTRSGYEGVVMARGPEESARFIRGALRGRLEVN